MQPLVITGVAAASNAFDPPALVKSAELTGNSFRAQARAACYSRKVA
jgi:hypothetical protein